MKKSQLSQTVATGGGVENRVSRRVGLLLVGGSLFAMALAAPAVLRADQILLKDGTNVYGKISAVDAGVISITPGFNADGSVKVFKFKMEDVLNFTSNDPIYIGTAAESNQTADSIAFGTVESAPTGVRIKTSAGAITVPLSQIKIAYRTQEESPQALAIKKLERKWTAEMSIDLRGKEASAGQMGTSVGFTATNAGPNDSLVFYGKYNYYKSRDVGQHEWNKSADDLAAGINYSNNFTDRFLWYLRTNDGFNRITQIDFFSESGLGGGFQPIKEDNQKLEFRVGLGFRYEAYHGSYTVNGESARSLLGLDAGMTYSYQWSWGRFEDRISYMPAFDDFQNNFILRHEAALEFPIANTDFWWIRVGVSNDYNSRPADPRIRKLETTYFLRLVLRWK